MLCELLEDGDGGVGVPGGRGGCFRVGVLCELLQDGDGGVGVSGGRDAYAGGGIRCEADEDVGGGVGVSGGEAEHGFWVLCAGGVVEGFWWTVGVLEGSDADVGVAGVGGDVGEEFGWAVGVSGGGDAMFGIARELGGNVSGPDRGVVCVGGELDSGEGSVKSCWWAAGIGDGVFGGVALWVAESQRCERARQSAGMGRDRRDGVVGGLAADVPAGGAWRRESGDGLAAAVQARCWGWQRWLAQQRYDTEMVGVTFEGSAAVAAQPPRLAEFRMVSTSNAATLVVAAISGRCRVGMLRAVRSTSRCWSRVAFTPPNLACGCGWLIVAGCPVDGSSLHGNRFVRSCRSSPGTSPRYGTVRPVIV